MDRQKYLIIVTLIDGQNFSVPDGAPDRTEAHVFAEARFGNESILRSDPIKLTNSNPEFVTELAWELDKKSLHQLRVERKAIKLQVFLQIRERRKNLSSPDNERAATTNGSASNDSSETHKVELIGYTILDLRSAQQREKPKFQWLPLLNPKFRKSSYNRPEIQLALILSRVDEDSNNDDSSQFPSISSLPGQDTRNYPESVDHQKNNVDMSSERETNSNDTKLYTTCLDISTNSGRLERDEIIDNDIIIRSKEGVYYVYDANHVHKSTIEDCDESYKLRITIPFNSNLDMLTKDQAGDHYFSVNLFGTTFRTRYFQEMTSVESKEITIDLRTTHSGALATYFELNSNLDIKLHRSSGQSIGMASVQLNELCSLDTKCRSIEGIFALQPLIDCIDHIERPSPVNPSIGVSVVLEKLGENGFSNAMQENSDLIEENQLNMTKEHFGEDIDEFLYKSLHDTHQLTLDDGSQMDRYGGELNASAPVPCVPEGSGDTTASIQPDGPQETLLNEYVQHQDCENPERQHAGDINDDQEEQDHHYCFTIDLKKFSYTSDQRLIPTVRELVIRYSYPFFGYKDTITTDASIPINMNSSIIVSGFCEFNFATTRMPLLTALQELPLNLEILAFDDTRFKEFSRDTNERIVATCDLNLAEILELNEINIKNLGENPLNKTTSVPIFARDGEEIGQLQLYLCLKDLGLPTRRPKVSMESLPEAPRGSCSRQQQPQPLANDLIDTQEHRQHQVDLSSTAIKLEMFIADAKRNFESWRDDYAHKLAEDIRRADNERFKRVYQRLEAKEANRDQEFRKKIEDLTQLEKRFKGSLACVDSLEKMLAESLEQLKAKNAIMNTRLDMLDSKISQVLTSNNTCNNIDKQPRHEQQRRQSTNRGEAPPHLARQTQQRSLDDNLLAGDGRKTFTRVSSKDRLEKNSTASVTSRRSSLRNPNSIAGIPVPIRSSSLVRSPATEANGTSTKMVKRSGGITQPATVVNGINSRVRSNSARLQLSKETQEKLVNLRKEKAELLKRGCKPTDELIQEINSLIDKLAF